MSMTLRDLTPRQAYNLRRRCDKERKQYAHSFNIEVNKEHWEKAYTYGVKAALSQIPTKP